MVWIKKNHSYKAPTNGKTNNECNGEDVNGTNVTSTVWNNLTKVILGALVVRVRNPLNKKIKNVYAQLDSGSDPTLLTKCVTDEIRLKGEQEEITVNCINVR